eukprot:TRINITY_DN34291_c0_g1_i1.p2 TRINITY_DN34291_c0_g1~~TRINITY_DN34291_c0_g1_i1.p2  ORF type:complete len:121 (+),score=17.53 TRINITY_DN34291_c0_g1_i1:158-520(+)
MRGSIEEIRQRLTVLVHEGMHERNEIEEVPDHLLIPLCPPMSVDALPGGKEEGTDRTVHQTVTLTVPKVLHQPIQLVAMLLQECIIYPNNNNTLTGNNIITCKEWHTDINITLFLVHNQL